MTTQNNSAPQQEPNTGGEVKKRFEEGTVEAVLSKVTSYQNEGRLQLPANYSVENAVRSAWLLIQQTKDLNNKLALEVCTPVSIANAVFDMVLQGLSPVKKQVYFIVRGNVLTMMRSYFGTIAFSKRVAGVKECVAVPIYEGDTFKYKIDVATGVKTVTEHDQVFENLDPQKWKGAYAIVTYDDDRIEYDIMSKAQIITSWSMGSAGGNSPAHKKFPDQMACRTVINRALKIPVNSSNDDDLFTEVGESVQSQQVAADVKLKIAENANDPNNDGSIGFEDVEPGGETIILPLTPATDNPDLTQQPLESQIENPIPAGETKAKAPF
jgi:recombination protein RecT